MLLSIRSRCAVRRYFPYGFCRTKDLALRSAWPRVRARAGRPPSRWISGGAAARDIYPTSRGAAARVRDFDGEIRRVGRDTLARARRTVVPARSSLPRRRAMASVPPSRAYASGEPGRNVLLKTIGGGGGSAETPNRSNASTRGSRSRGATLPPSLCLSVRLPPVRAQLRRSTRSPRSTKSNVPSGDRRGQRVPLRLA